MSHVIEAIAVIRDVVIILFAVIIATMVILVARAVLDLTRKAEATRSFIVTSVTMALNPIKGLLLAIRRGQRREG